MNTAASHLSAISSPRSASHRCERARALCSIQRRLGGGKGGGLGPNGDKVPWLVNKGDLRWVGRQGRGWPQ